MDLEQRLSSWTGPSSDTEQDKQARTERMVREAIEAHPAFGDCQMKVYAKGSYPNNTNVRTESDVDIAVQCSEVFYWEEISPGIYGPPPSYTGPWTPARLRSEVGTALRSVFSSQVDSTGNIALNVASGTARVNADVVPCFDYRYYFSSYGYRAGTKIFPKRGTPIVNYPQQHLDHGRAKNTRTNHYFKKVVRILKRTSNSMAADGYHRSVPSFLIESLVYNCPDDMFLLSTWTTPVKHVIGHIWEGTQGSVEPSDSERWLEVNECKYLFHSGQKWTRKDARDFAHASWNYLGLAGHD